MLVARRSVLRGRVQGVGLRFFVQEAATAEGLSGWVANRPDGTVEILAEGDEQAVRRFEAHVRRGPAGARIDDISVDEDVPSSRARGFAIRS